MDHGLSLTERRKPFKRDPASHLNGLAHLLCYAPREKWAPVGFPVSDVDFFPSDIAKLYFQIHNLPLILDGSLIVIYHVVIRKINRHQNPLISELSPRSRPCVKGVANKSQFPLIWAEMGKKKHSKGLRRDARSRFWWRPSSHYYCHIRSPLNPTRVKGLDFKPTWMKCCKFPIPFVSEQHLAQLFCIRVH